MSDRYVIVGAGEAGVAAAAAIRARSPEASIILISDEPGHPYERPPLSKAVLTGDPVPTLLRSAEWYDDNRIERLHAQARTIDPAARTLQVASDGGAQSVLAYDKLLIATGAQARRLPYDGVLHLRRWDEALAIREGLAGARRVAVIGGGVIGLELASSARAMGREVVVIEMADRLMARALAPEVSAWLKDLHVGAGVDVRLSTAIAGVTRTEAGSFVIALADGSSVEADIVVAGIGASPETALAASAGCAIDDGIVVDAHGRTSVADVFAAGDNARFQHGPSGAPIRLEAWQHAGRHGAHIGTVMAGGEDPYACTPWFWTDQHGVNLQVAGFPAEADRTVWRGSDGPRTAFHLAGDRLVAVSTIDNGREMRPAIQLLEAGWHGDGATLADSGTPMRAIVQAWRQG